jgi:hypothetical protein
MKRSSKRKGICFISILLSTMLSLSIPGTFAASDLDKDFLTAKNVSVNSFINGELNNYGETHYYKFTTGSAGIYTVGTSGCTDTYGFLYDKNQKLLNENDDGDSGSNNFCITQMLAANQTYYVAVRNFLDEGLGSYTLRVNFGNVLIQSIDKNSGTDNQSISPSIRVFNLGKEDINLSDIKVRYYFNSDTKSELAFACNSASIGKDNVLGKFVKLSRKAPGADCYLEITFAGKAGVLKSGDYAELDVLIEKSDKKLYNQFGNYSFNPSPEDFTNWHKITAYVNDKLHWGEEPEKLPLFGGIQCDYIDAGNSKSEREHNLQTWNSAAAMEDNYSVRKTSDKAGAWFSYDLSVPAGVDKVFLDIRETYRNLLTRNYNIYIDGVLIKRYIQTSAYTSINTITAEGLSSLTEDGKITLKFETVKSDINAGPSISDILVRT